MQKVKGHPGWWKMLEFKDVGHTRYNYFPPSSVGESKVFIDREEKPRRRHYGVKYAIFRSGAGIDGGAGYLGGANTLKEAIKKAEKIMKARGELQSR